MRSPELSFDVSAPEFVEVDLYPRVRSADGVPRNKQPDDEGQDQYFETFHVNTVIATKADSTPREPGPAPPQITAVDINKGSFTVHWDAPAAVNRQNVRFAIKRTPDVQEEIGPARRSYRVDWVKANSRWGFGVQVHTTGGWSS